jgi:hypothetical protein
MTNGNRERLGAGALLLADFGRLEAEEEPRQRPEFVVAQRPKRLAEPFGVLPHVSSVRRG